MRVADGQAPAISNPGTGRHRIRGAAEHPADALFILIGSQPRTQWLGDSLARDQGGSILTGPDLPGDTTAHWPPDRTAAAAGDELAGGSRPVTCAGDQSRGSRPRWARVRADHPLVHRHPGNHDGSGTFVDLHPEVSLTRSGGQRGANLDATTR